MPPQKNAERRHSDPNEINARNFGAVTSSSVCHFAIEPRQCDDAIADSIRVRRDALSLGSIELVERFFDGVWIERHDRRLT
ncbi:MAG TPA: hypothetical protein VEO36_14205, partial [Casimicrobiaceae bacterium]|nr:hypothetical protein [Casimicrobiaceae bacterium]